MNGAEVLQGYLGELEPFLSAVPPFHSRSVLVVLDVALVSRLRPSLASSHSPSGHAFLWLDPPDVIEMIDHGRMVSGPEKLAGFRVKLQAPPPHRERWCLVVQGRATALFYISTQHQPAGPS